MRVLLKATWFAPTEVKKLDRIRSISGKRYRKGEQEIPDELREFLPKDAIILGEETMVFDREASPDTFSEFNKMNELHALDLDRAAAEAEEKVRTEAEKDRPKKGKK